MSLIEIIDKLCHVTTVLADLVREQSNIIAQSDVCIMDDGADGASISDKMNQAYDELDEIEMALRKIKQLEVEK